jgi:hypothetical protein
MEFASNGKSQFGRNFEICMSKLLKFSIPENFGNFSNSY